MLRSLISNVLFDHGLNSERSIHDGFRRRFADANRAFTTR